MPDAFPSSVAFTDCDFRSFSGPGSFVRVFGGRTTRVHPSRAFRAFFHARSCLWMGGRQSQIHPCVWPTPGSRSGSNGNELNLIAVGCLRTCRRACLREVKRGSLRASTQTRRGLGQVEVGGGKSGLGGAEFSCFTQPMGREGGTMGRCTYHVTVRTKHSTYKNSTFHKMYVQIFVSLYCVFHI